MFKYFSEIKNRLFLILVTFFSTVAICYFYKEALLFSVVQPNIFVYFNKDSTFFYFIFTNVTEIFSVYLQLVLFLGFQILIIFLFYHGFIFFSPSFFFSEYFFIFSILKTILFIWFLSLLLLNYVLVPLTWNFFLSFQNFTKAYSFNLHFEAKLNEYLNFYIELYYLCVLYCQIFTILFLFLIFTNVDSKVTKKFRKLYYYFFIIFSTLVSPPDVLSQALISILTVAIYESLVFILMFRSSAILLVRQPIKTNKNTYSEQ